MLSLTNLGQNAGFRAGALKLRALSKDSLSLTLISAISLFPPHAQRPESQQNLPADAVFAVRPKFFRFCGKTGRYLPI